jgi:NADPH2:quinone reductase
MKVVQAQQSGPPEVLEAVEVPAPEPGPGQVVVDVAVAGIAFIETQVRAGTFSRPTDTFPLVPGNAVGGTIAATGDGVDPTLVGRRVVTSTGGYGGYAERVVVGTEEPHEVPDELDLPTAVALLTDGRTAVLLTQAADIRPGDRVLVTAAGGGLGSLIVQLARQAGAGTIVALAGGEPKLARARELGADITVDYRTPGWAEAVRGELIDLAGSDGVDVVFDGVGGTVTDGASSLVAEGARYVVHGMASGAFPSLDPQLVDEHKVQIVNLQGMPSTPADMRAAVDTALAAAAEGTLVPTIGQTFPLDQAAAAHAAIESRATLGKTLLLVADTGPPSP